MADLEIVWQRWFGSHQHAGRGRGTGAGSLVRTERHYLDASMRASKTSLFEPTKPLFSLHWCARCAGKRDGDAKHTQAIGAREFNEVVSDLVEHARLRLTVAFVVLVSLETTARGA